MRLYYILTRYKHISGEAPPEPSPAPSAGVDFLAFPPINIGERYKKIFDLRKVISQSEILFDLKQLHQLSVGL